jgi:hypothetical protein
MQKTLQLAHPHDAKAVTCCTCVMGCFGVRKFLRIALQLWDRTSGSRRRVWRMQQDESHTHKSGECLQSLGSKHTRSLRSRQWRIKYDMLTFIFMITYIYIKRGGNKEALPVRGCPARLSLAAHNEPAAPHTPHCQCRDCWQQAAEVTQALDDSPQHLHDLKRMLAQHLHAACRHGLLSILQHHVQL